MSMMVSFVLSFFPRDVLDEILNLIESVSEDFPSYSFRKPKKRFFTLIKQQKSHSNTISSFKSNGVAYTQPVDKSRQEYLNTCTQIQSVFTKLLPLKLFHLIELILPKILDFLPWWTSAYQ